MLWGGSSRAMQRNWVLPPLATRGSQLGSGSSSLGWAFGWCSPSWQLCCNLVKDSAEKKNWLSCPQIPDPQNHKHQLLVFEALNFQGIYTTIVTRANPKIVVAVKQLGLIYHSHYVPNRGWQGASVSPVCRHQGRWVGKGGLEGRGYAELHTYFVSFLAMPCSIWDLSSLSRERTHASCIGSLES